MPSLPASDVLIFDDVTRAAKVLADVAVKTPLLESPLLNKALGCRLRVKAEPLQITGSFKFRGAYNAISRIPKNKRGTGVVAYSSGNHGQGVAAAGRMLGVPAAILMPADAPATKVALTRAWGADVISYDRLTEDRAELAAKLQRDRGATLIKPYDDPLIMAGQGTLALEVIDDCKADGSFPDLFLCPAGGGGLIAGCSTVLRQQSANTEIYTVEPEGFDDHARSFQTGEKVANDPDARSICDALLSQTPGDLTFQVNRERVNGGLSVSDDDVRGAMGVAFRFFKMVVEPGGAVALAAVLSAKEEFAGKDVVVVCSGGNVDAETYAEALARPIPF